MKHLAVIIVISCAALVSSSTYAASVFTLPSGVHVKIIESPFQATQFKVSGCGEHDSVCLINGKPPFGVAFGLPKTYVKAIIVTFQGQSYSLDSSDMFNAWGNRPLEVKGVIRYFGGKCSDAKDCTFRGIFSDGAATFVAEWRIADGNPTRDVLTDSSDIIDLFMHDIDPPEDQ